MTIRGWLSQNLKTHNGSKDLAGLEEDLAKCPSCGASMSSIQAYTSDELVSHNSETCRLVNLVLAELAVSFAHMIRVEIYYGAGPLRGFYFTADPYTIHISEVAYLEFREYIIFHETKHLVDCLTRGRSEEATPDRFPRYLCAKYGYDCPPDELVSGFPYA
jgi:hypothetical protein